MITERFRQLRQQELSVVFSKKNIVNIWLKVVRDQLRRADIYDIFDYYDFSYNIDERALLIRSELLNGDYQCSNPLIYRLEKKFGVCRHLIMPQPTDALILQVITETLSPQIREQQPSDHAFYSQDKHNVKQPHEIDEYGFHWRELWKKLQKLIYQFNEGKELLVVTDLSNYYDSIDMGALRKKITQLVGGKEVLLDLLFHIIEKITWCPDYLPYSGHGLPTTNIEGIRLLAHLFLFELDSILKERTNDSFTRWMDDIVIGVDSRKEAVETLSLASDVLVSRGLALHLVKTAIYDSEKAEYHFQIEKNKYLDSIETFFKDKSRASDTIENDVFQKFEEHLEDREPKYWEKVCKRFITAFGMLESSLLLPKITALYQEVPGIRPNLLIYLSRLGYNKETCDVVLRVASELSVFDDISLFQLCKLVTEWNIDTGKVSKAFLRKFEQVLFSVSMERREPFDFFCLLWFKAKYAHPDSLFNFVEKYTNIWRTSPFLRREVTAVMARIFVGKEGSVRKFMEAQIATGDSQVASVANQILAFSQIDRLERKVKMYLFPEHRPAVYPLYKFLVLCSFLNSRQVRLDQGVREKVVTYLRDDHYLKWIELLYDIS